MLIRSTRIRSTPVRVSPERSSQLLLVALLLACGAAHRVTGVEWRTAGRFAWNRGAPDGMEVSPATQLRLVSFAGTNVALGTRARVDGRNISTRVTDGNTATVWNFLDDPEVLGRVVALDLGGNRLIDRIRVLPAGGNENPEFFVYRKTQPVLTDANAIEVAGTAEFPQTPDLPWVRGFFDCFDGLLDAA